MQAKHDDTHRSYLAKKTQDKMARVDAIETQRTALLVEMQNIRRDIGRQEAWLKVRRACDAACNQLWAGLTNLLTQNWSTNNCISVVEVAGICRLEYYHSQKLGQDATQTVA